MTLTFVCQHQQIHARLNVHLIRYTLLLPAHRRPLDSWQQIKVLIIRRVANVFLILLRRLVWWFSSKSSELVRVKSALRNTAKRLKRQRVPPKTHRLTYSFGQSSSCNMWRRCYLTPPAGQSHTGVMTLLWCTEIHASASNTSSK